MTFDGAAANWSLLTDLFQILLGFKGGHTSRSRSAYRLPIMTVGHIAADKYTRRPAAYKSVGHEITIAIAVKLLTHKLSVWRMPDTQEHGTDRKVPLLASLQVAQPKSGDFLFAHVEDVIHHGVSEKNDLLVFAGALKHDLRGPELAAAMNDGDLGCEAGKEQRLFHRRIAATDDGYLFPRKEETIARSARGNAVANECLLAGKAQPARRSAAGNDEGTSQQPLAA